MRRDTLRLVLPLLAALAAAACKEEGVEGPNALCSPVGSGCSADADCCSYGCRLGACLPNPLEGGACRTHDDCGSPRVCVGQQCTSSMTCLDAPAACDGTVPCCSGVCSSGLCTADRPPVAAAGLDRTVPYRVPLVLENASTDPDTGLTGLSYSWGFLAVPDGSAFEVGPFSSVRAPTFTPDVVGDFVVVLQVTRGAHSPSDTVTIHSVNTPPEVTAMPADVADPQYQPRNVALTFSATLQDADGGPVSCSWSRRSPGSVTTPYPGGPVACAGATGTAAIGQSTVTFSEDEAGIWEVILTVDDGVNPPLSRSRFVNVQNDAPELQPRPATAKMPTRYGNVGLDPVPLHGTVFDRNGDAVTWTWSVLSQPPGSTPRFFPANGVGQDVQFEADVPGPYTLNLSVNDGHGGFDDKAIDVMVDPYVLPLGEVLDAAWVSDTRIVMVGLDAGAPKLWVVNPVTPAVTNELALGSRPTTVRVSPDGTTAIVGREGALWDVVNLSTVTFQGASRPGLTPVDVAWSAGYVFATTAGGAVYELFPANQVTPFHRDPQRPPGSTVAPRGTRLVGRTIDPNTAWLWVLDPGDGNVARFSVKASNAQLETVSSSMVTPLIASRGLWLSASGTELFTSTQGVYSSTPPFGSVSTLRFAPRHVCSVNPAGVAQGVFAHDAFNTLVRFSAPDYSAEVGDLVLPFLGVAGQRVDPFGRFAFVTSDGRTFHAVVVADRGTASTADDLWGLVTITPPP
jgi:hypothetical protein